MGAQVAPKRASVPSGSMFSREVAVPPGSGFNAASALR